MFTLELIHFLPNVMIVSSLRDYLVTGWHNKEFIRPAN